LDTLRALGDSEVRPPVLLTMAGYHGSLAALRCLGRAGISVTVAADRFGLPAAWSRWTRRRVRCPDVRDAEQFIDWLLEFGSREPGYVLYPTSDDLAYLFALHRDLLVPWFRLYQPPLATILGLLDKKSLIEAAERAGIETPRTYFAGDDAELEWIARNARFPLLIKPRTQVLFRTRNKGVRVERQTDLTRAYHAYVRANSYLPLLLRERSDIARPMLQEYECGAETNTESVAGFVDESGELFVVRGARKMLQYPRRAGIGVCFEDAEVDPDGVRSIAALCRETGYFGVFESEFIRVNGRRLLIDFNPRYYNQMAFEIARGLPLPLLTYAAAIGDREWLRQTVCAAHSTVTPGPTAWCHRFVFWMLVGSQRLSRSASADEVRKWRAWFEEHRSRIVDPAVEGDDRLPGLMDVLLQLRPLLSHPRAFLRATALAG
jgi:predicted ATP-grasp superfamily ATP-dependent carboligase